MCRVKSKPSMLACKAAGNLSDWERAQRHLAELAAGHGCIVWTVKQLLRLLSSPLLQQRMLQFTVIRSLISPETIDP